MKIRAASMTAAAESTILVRIIKVVQWESGENTKFFAS